ncbi:hypothetical protein K438DRAFT_2024156 [Mycena galopus ATCC 62051]|nr:hypothetical protein K438DRAFT_2024156 [Mycena galopus ATCC 62051]
MQPPPVPDHHQFMDCPRAGCNARFPAILVCSGRRVAWHAGLQYHACSECGYFKWLDPEQFAAAERRARDSPANGALPYPPLLPDPASLSPPLPHWNGFSIDPSLQPQAASQAPTASQPPPLSQATSKSGKAKCPGGCTRVSGSRNCSWMRCKACYAAERPAFHVDQRCFSALAPTPNLDLATTSNEPVAVKIYKKPMAVEWVKQYNANHQERQAHLLVERQVQVCCWTQDGADLEWAREQGVLTYPKLSLADYPKLLKKLGLTETDDLYIYDFNGQCFRREDMDYVMLVPSSQVVLARHVGVTDCPRLDEYIAKYGKHSTAAGPGRRAVPPSSKRKANAMDFPASLKTLQLTSTNPEFLRPVSPPSSASSCPSTPSTSTTPSVNSPPSCPSSLPIPPSQSPVAAPSPPSLTSADVLRPWPEGVYARDMVAAFQKIIPKSKTPIDNRFRDVFHRGFPKGAWYQNVKAWKGSEQMERDAAALLPRDESGLWNVWRSKSSGWAKVCAEKKH